MKFLKNRLRMVAGALMLLAVSACQQDGSNTPGPTEPDQLLGLNLGGSLGGYTLANDPILPNLLNEPLKVSQLVSLQGGTIQLLGHKLTIPAGAVLQPTLFSLIVLPTGHVEVHLTAISTNWLGMVLNVGKQGFKKPVKVTLTYERSTNVADPSTLIILREKGLFGQPEPMPSTVDTATKTVTADLDHFSRYFIAFPD